jgi:Uma2 family endonuclease
MTLHEFLNLPNSPRGELVDGVFYLVPPAGGAHGNVNSRLSTRLGAYVLEHDLGDVYDSSTAFVLRVGPPALVRSPDVSFVARGTDDPSIPPGSVALAPDLAVETLSPSERPGEVQRKVDEYLDHGAALVWLVDPQRRTAAVHARGRGALRLTEADALDGEGVVPGFSVPLAFLFARLAREP